MVNAQRASARDRLSSWAWGATCEGAALRRQLSYEGHESTDLAWTVKPRCRPLRVRWRRRKLKRIKLFEDIDAHVLGNGIAR
jgi:hypothetical protein